MIAHRYNIFITLIALQLQLNLNGQNIRPETGYPYTWEQLRAMDEFDYQSRWDDLTLLRTPYWVNAREFAELFGFERNLEIKELDGGDMRYQVKDRRREYPVLTLRIRVYGDTKEVASQEKDIKDMISTLGNDYYETIPSIASDIRAYHRKDRGWVYIFHENGISYFFIDYHKTLDETLRYMQKIESDDPKFDIARLFFNYLIMKYDPIL